MDRDPEVLRHPLTQALFARVIKAIAAVVAVARSGASWLRLQLKLIEHQGSKRAAKGRESALTSGEVSVELALGQVPGGPYIEGLVAWLSYLGHLSAAI